MSARTYKKYMKQDYKKDYGLWKLFIISFFGMLFVFTYLINSFSPSVDVSIGDYKQEEDNVNYEEVKKIQSAFQKADPVPLYSLYCVRQKERICM